MKSNTESGMANTLANFGTLIRLVTSFGSKYTPPKERLGLAMLNLLLQATGNSIEVAGDRKRDHDNAVIARKAAFALIKRLAARVISALKVAEAPAGVIEDAEAIKRRMDGRRSSPATGTLGENTLPGAPKSISSAQTGFINQVKHFSDLVDIVERESAYAPNEPELQVSELQAVIVRLQEANALVADTWVASQNAKNQRDAFFYAEVNGLISTAAAVKEYVKSAFEPNSAQAGQVTGLPFPRRKKVAVKEITLPAAA